jgi:hypothetical protein
MVRKTMEQALAAGEQPTRSRVDHETSASQGAGSGTSLRAGECNPGHFVPKASPPCFFITHRGAVDVSWPLPRPGGVQAHPRMGNPPSHAHG